MPSWNEALMIGMGDALTKMAASKKQGTIHVPGATLPGPGETLGKLKAQIAANTKVAEVKLPAGAETKKIASFEFLKEAMTKLKSGVAASRSGMTTRFHEPESSDDPSTHLLAGRKGEGEGGRGVSLSFLRSRGSKSYKRHPKGIEEGQEKARAKEREDAGEKESKLPMWMKEREKTSAAVGPTYPISRFLTSRRGAALLGGLGAAAGPGGLAAAPVMGAAQAAGAHGGRWLFARGMRGRFGKGGKGLWGFEKERMAEALGVSPSALNSALANIAAKTKATKGKTYPISRLLTHSLAPLDVIPGKNILSRFLLSRGTAGRAKTGYKHFLGQEKAALDDLKKALPAGAQVRGGIARILEKASKKVAG